MIFEFALGLKEPNSRALILLVAHPKKSNAKLCPAVRLTPRYSTQPRDFPYIKLSYVLPKDLRGSKDSRYWILHRIFIRRYQCLLQGKHNSSARNNGGPNCRC